MYYFLKRFLDIIGAIVALLLLGSFLLIGMVAIYLQMGRPLFFIQQRPGRNKKRFRMIKLRSMLLDPESKLSDEERITPLGQVIRKYSIDEIPQLLNVLKGDMSLVGPRPLLLEYDDLYSDLQNRRFEVKPGITGWAQVNGRNELSWEKKLELDVEYVKSVNLWMDIRILVKTFWVVLGSVGFRLSGEDEKFGAHKKKRDR